MANIVGEPFDEWVNKQIDNRQKVHGSQNRDSKILSYLNSKTGWIKLTSGVKVSNDDRMKKIGLYPHNFTDTRLAERFILFGGVFDENSPETLNAGIYRGNDKGQSILDNKAYGLGGNDFGLRPMAGIKSAETKFRNRGSIREGTIQIKCWDRTQFEILNILYLRLGFPILLEWGHTIIIDSNGEITPTQNFDISSRFLAKEFKTDNEVLEAINKQRETSAGNYDAMYGKVQNFDWTFNRDGSYDITLKIISLGAVIESLKMNVYHRDLAVTSPTDVKEGDNSDDAPENDEDWITKFRFSHTIGYVFWEAMKLLFDKNVDLKMDTIDTISRVDLEQKLNFPIKTGNPDNADYILYGLEGAMSTNELFYIRFGELFNLLKLLIPVNVDNPSNPQPLIDVINLDDLSKPENKVIMYTEKGQLSGNPKKCLVGGYIIGNLMTLDALKFNPYQYDIDNKGNIIGLLKNVYINMAFILQLLEEKKDKDGKVNFIELVQGILDGVNESLGGINKLEVIIDEDKNIIKVVENTPIPNYENIMGLKDKIKDSTEILLYGYYNNSTQAGFVRDFSLKTEITNDLAAMMTIGATANGGVVGEDATAFSKWNVGLAPIIGENMTSGLSNDTSKNSSQTTLSIRKEIDETMSSNKQLIDNYFKFVVKTVSYNLSDEDIDGGTQLVTNFLTYLRQIDLLNTKLKKLTEVNALKNFKTNQPKLSSYLPPTTPVSSKGFLPINLSLTMDGLSGIKIYQKLKVDTSYLPSDYPDALNFIIKGVTHKMDRSGWITMVETVSVPIIDTLELTKDTGTIPNPTNTNKPSLETSPDSKNEARNDKNYVSQPNANKLRQTINQLGYKEKGNELDNGGQDISSNIEKAVSSVLRTIKAELPNVMVRVTGGNDKYHQNLGYNSRHKAGNAVDLTISPSDIKTLDKVKLILQRYAAGNSPNFRFIDEYRNLTAAGTGNHFHLSFGSGTESQIELNKALLLAQQGKITPIKIS